MKPERVKWLRAYVKEGREGGCPLTSSERADTETISELLDEITELEEKLKSFHTVFGESENLRLLGIVYDPFIANCYDIYGEPGERPTIRRWKNKTERGFDLLPTMVGDNLKAKYATLPELLDEIDKKGKVKNEQKKKKRI